MIKLLWQIIKFSIVGIIAFFIDFGIFTGIIFAGKIFVGDYLIDQGWFTIAATTIAFTVSVIFNYIASMKFVFTHKDDMSKTKEFIIFVILSLIGLGINDLIVWLFAHGISWPFNISQEYIDMGAKIIATGVVMIWNFITRKIFLDAGDKNQENNKEINR